MEDSRVIAVSGKRRSDLSTFHGLKFFGPHRPFFLTPAQVEAVINLQDEARQIIKNLPDTTRKGQKGERG